jgi:uridylate kinase
MLTTQKPVYQRVLLKLSGEFLQGDADFGLDVKALQQVNEWMKEVLEVGVQIGIVIGGGNFLRGAAFSKKGLDRVTSDHMGMLATVMNGIALKESFIQANLPAHVMSSFMIPGLVEMYDRHQASYYLNKNQIVIFVGGTGCPLFSTDSAASLRGIEIKADVILKATKVDGIYDSDPKKNPNAKFFSQLTYDEAIKEELQVMDLTAMCLCRDHRMPLRVFNMYEKGILQRILLGSSEGTVINS